MMAGMRRPEPASRLAAVCATPTRHRASPSRRAGGRSSRTRPRASRNGGRAPRCASTPAPRAAGSRSASLLAWGRRRAGWTGCGRSRMRAVLRRRASLWRRGAWRRKSATGSAPSATAASRSPMRAFRWARAAHAPGAGACAGRLGRSLDLGLEASRVEAANDNDPDHGIAFRLTARW